MRTGLAAGVKICMIGTIDCEANVGEIVDSHQHHFSETPVFAGCGVGVVGTNECASTS